jgi:hypothetical protein
MPTVTSSKAVGVRGRTALSLWKFNNYVPYKQVFLALEPHFRYQIVPSKRRPDEHR